jgi:hypothetical protein
VDVTLKAAIDTWDAEGAAQSNHGDDARLALNAPGGGDEKDAFVFFHRPFKHGDNVVSATLTVYLRDAWAGSRDIQVDRINEPWREDTLTWNNAPSDIDSADRATATVSSGADGDAVDIDVTDMLATVSGGAAWYGFFLTLSAGGDLYLHSSETAQRHRRPTLEVRFATTPDAPTDLSPDGHVIGRAKPRLNWAFQDRSGQSDQKSFQVQIDSSDTFPTPFDTGWVVDRKTQVDLNATAYPGVPEGATRYWRVRARDDDGNTSAWSLVATMKKVAKGDVTITHPTEDGDVHTHTPNITHTLSAGTQEATEYILKEWDRIGAEWRQIYKRGKKTTTDTALEIPKHLIKKEDAIGGVAFPYRIVVRVWDTEDRQHSAGDLAYSQSQAEFRFHRAEDDIVDLLDATQPVPHAPYVRLRFHYKATRGEHPVWFALRVTRPGADPVFVDQRIDPLDLLDPAGATYNYEYDYWNAIDGEATIYHMCPVILDAGELKVITGNASDTLTTDLWGVWITRPSSGDMLFIAGRGSIGATIGESSTAHMPIGRRAPVLITDSIRGYEGSVSGVLVPWSGLTAEEYAAMLEDFKGLAGSDELRLAIPNKNFPIQIPGGVVIQPSQAANGGLYDVTVPYLQTGEFTFPTHVEA